MSDVPAVTLADGRTVKLGRLPPRRKFGEGKLWLHDYLGILGTVEPPAPCDYTAKAIGPLGRMYCNDRLGCCVMSGAFHDLGVKTGNSTANPVEATDEEVQEQYFHLSGGRDGGLVISDMLDHWRDKGLVVSGGTFRIDDYIAIDHTNARAVKWAIYIFGGAKVGLNLPGSWQAAKVWDVANAGRIVGGHDVEFFGYDEKGDVKVSTWGSLRTMTADAVADRRIIDEMYAVAQPDWEAKAPNGIDLSTLKSDLQAMRDGRDPVITPTPPPWLELMGGGL